MKTNVKATNLALLTENQAILSSMQVICAALLIGASAHIKVPLFFTPVPLSMQTLTLMLLGSFLGSRKGALAACFYLVWGGFGTPLFVGGPASFAYLLGPTGGYLVGFVAQAYLSGLFAAKIQGFSGLKASCFLSLTCVVQLSLGAAWLAQFVGWENVWLMGFAPFIPGELLKSLVSGAVLKFRAVY